MPVITLTTGETTDFAPRGIIGLLSETAPDGKFRAEFPGAVSFSEIFSDRNKVRRQASELASKLISHEPALRGVQQLRVFEEVLIGELEPILLVLNLVEWLRANNMTACELIDQSWLSSFTHILATEAKIAIKTSLRPNGGRNSTNLLRKRAARVVGRLRQSGLSRSSLYQEWRQFLDHIDPYHRRPTIGRQRRHWHGGGIWFYTTAHTFTNIGLAYEPYFPSPFNFLVENPIRGGAPLKSLRRPWTSLYEFSSPRFAPAQSEIESSRHLIEHHLRNVQLNVREARAREEFLSGKYFAEFCTRLLPMGLYYARVFEEWVMRVRPAALVVGNFVYEAYALLAARRHGIPTILLQHGIVGDCEVGEPPADHYVVRGKFWQSFLPEKARNRSKVLNFWDRDEPNLPRESRRSLLFLTAPYSMQRFWTESDLDDILASLLRCALERSVELIVRVHPLENIGFYRRRIQTLLPSRERAHFITYSRGGSLDALLARSAVAVTYSSTAFLDCLRWQVPIVSFNWHDFTYKERIRDRGVFYFAESLAELEELVLRGLSGGLAPYRDGVEPFLASTPKTELTRELERMVSTEPLANAS